MTDVIDVASRSDVADSARDLKTHDADTIVARLERDDWDAHDDRVLVWVPEWLNDKPLTPLDGTGVADRGTTIADVWVVTDTDGGNDPDNDGAWGLTQVPPATRDDDLELVWAPKASVRIFNRDSATDSIRTAQVGITAFTGDDDD